MPEAFRRRVLEALATVGPGTVVSYGDLAAQAGYPGAARGVGAVLAGSAVGEVAWWRVVYADSRLAPGHEVDQARRLSAEGVAVTDGRVVAPLRVPGVIRPRPRPVAGRGQRVDRSSGSI